MSETPLCDAELAGRSIRVISAKLGKQLETDLATLRRKLDEAEKERDELSRTIEDAHHIAMLDWPGSEVPLLGQVESLFSALKNLYNTKYSEVLRVAGDLAKALEIAKVVDLSSNPARRKPIDVALAAYRALTADGPTPPSASPSQPDSSR